MLTHHESSPKTVEHARPRRLQVFSLLVRALLLPSVLVASHPAAALAEEEGSGRTIAPRDVFAHVELLQSEVEALRNYMGKPRNQQQDLLVSKAAPREVYFQALTLFDKADRLCFEQTRQRARPPRAPAGDAQPADVLHVVSAALDRVREVKQHYELDVAGVAAQPTDDKSPNDVFRVIVQTNRQLNLLLDERFSPSDVFQHVTHGIGYAARLLEQFPNAEIFPSEPEFEPGKTPADVYRRLLTCFDKVRALAATYDEDVLELRVDEALINEAEPSDVYDIASLVVAELAHLHSQVDNANPPRKVYFAGRKLPADVWQRVGVLERQLDELVQHASSQPQETGEK
jgi:hypothetical protein